MRVLQAMAGAHHGGAEAFFTRLAIALHRAGVDQHIVVREDRERILALREGGLDPVGLRFGGAFDLSTRRRLRREIRRYRPDVVLSWMNRATAFCPGGPFVHAARLGGYYDLKYYRRCDHLIGNTQGICQYLREAGWADERVHHLPNFVTAGAAEPVRRAAHFTSDDVPLLLALGRWHENKGFDVLLDALAQLPGVYLWLLGEGPLDVALKEQAERLGVAPRVRFLGWQDDPAAYYAAADLVVCSSRVEPLGNVVLEAWARRRPVVAAAAQGPSELIEDGVTGLLATLEDATALANAIRYVLEAPKLAQRMVKQGREAYEQHFAEAAVVRQYKTFFEKVAAR